MYKQPLPLSSGVFSSWDSSPWIAAAAFTSRLSATLPPGHRSHFSCFHLENLRQADIFKVNFPKWNEEVQIEIWKKKLSLH